MRIALSALIVVSSLAALVLAQEPAPSQSGQVFRSGSRTVAVYVTVSDEQGGLVPNLTEDDFEIYDNGKKQTITLFENGIQPITLVMMLDRSGSMVGNFSLVRSAAEQFVGLLLPGDKARIGSFANRIQVDPRDFTTSQHDLLQILRTELQEPGPTPLWNAVNVGITSLLHQEGRRVVLVFTDGIDRPMGSNNISYRDVEKNAEQEDVMIFADRSEEPGDWRRAEARRPARHRRHGAGHQTAARRTESRCRPSEDRDGHRRRVFRVDVDEQSRPDIPANRGRASSPVRARVYAGKARWQDAQVRSAPQETDPDSARPQDVYCEEGQ